MSENFIPPRAVPSIRDSASSIAIGQANFWNGHYEENINIKEKEDAKKTANTTRERMEQPRN